MPIVLISESWLRRSFQVASSVAGKQFHMVLGYRPLMRVDETLQQQAL